MTPETTTIGLIVGITIALIELVKYLGNLAYKFFTKETDKEKINVKQEVDIAIIKEKVMMLYTNHIPHIENRLDKIDEKLEKILLK